MVWKTYQDRKEYYRQRYLCNKEKIIAQQKEYRMKNPEKRRVIAKKYYETSEQCRERVKYSNLKYYQITDKEKYEDRRDLMRNIKEAVGCLRCGIRDGRVLDFHHLNPDEKEFLIGGGSFRRSMEVVWKEIRKCIILCANCHRIVGLETETTGKHKKINKSSKLYIPPVSRF